MLTIAEMTPFSLEAKSGFESYFKALAPMVDEQ
jgi:hypothetical protein